MSSMVTFLMPSEWNARSATPITFCLISSRVCAECKFPFISSVTFFKVKDTKKNFPAKIVSCQNVAFPLETGAGTGRGATKRAGRGGVTGRGLKFFGRRTGANLGIKIYLCRVSNQKYRSL